MSSFLSTMLVVAASSTLAAGFVVENDDSEWPQYTWPRSQNHERMYPADHGSSERYNELMGNVESQLDSLQPVEQGNFPRGYGEPQVPAPQQQGYYPPQARATSPATPYPPIYQNAAPAPAPAYAQPTYAPQPSYAQPAYVPPTPNPSLGQVSAYHVANPAYQQRPSGEPKPMHANYSPNIASNPNGMMRDRINSQHSFNEDPSQFWQLSFGSMLGYVPEFEASDQHDLIPLPLVDVSYRETFFVNTQLGAGINIYKENGFRAGPFMTIDLGRDSTDALFLAGAEDVDPTIESGIFFEKNLEPFNFLWTARYAIFNEGHGGVVSDAELSYMMQFQPGFYGTIGGALSWASKDYMISYFGVDAAHSARSGLNRYTPSADFKDLGLFTNLHYVVDERVSLLANMGVKRYRGEAADSPITEAGSNVQWYGGTGFLYNF